MTFRLHSRLVLWNLLIIGLISSILGYFLNFSLRQDIEKQIESQLEDQTVLAAAYLSRADSTKSLDAQADELGRLLNVRATIIAHDGRVLGDSDVEESQLPALENHRLRPEVRQAAKEAGALSMVISGAGPTLCAVCSSEATSNTVAQAMKSVYDSAGIASVERHTQIAAEGAKVMLVD